LIRAEAARGKSFIGILLKKDANSLCNKRFLRNVASKIYDTVNRAYLTLRAAVLRNKFSETSGMKWKVVASIWFLIAGFIIGTWLAHGAQILTKDKVQVVTKKVNPNFGVEEEIVEWKPQFRLGLEYGAPATILCLLVGGVCWRLGREKRPDNDARISSSS
jgi:hypothetical protein